MRWVLVHIHKKSVKHRNPIKTNFIERTILASGFGVSKIQKKSCLLENPETFCNRICLKTQEEQSGNNTNMFQAEIVAITDKLLEYKCTTSTKHKNVLNKF